MHMVEMCLSATSKLFHIFAFTSGSGCYVDWRKIWNEFACQDYRSMSRSFLKGSRSLGRVMTYSVAGIEILSPMASFYASAGYVCSGGCYVFTMSRCLDVCPVTTLTCTQGGRVHYTHAAAEASCDRPRS